MYFCVQLVYDFKDGGGSIGLMSLHPDQISNEEKDKFRKMGVQMPSMLWVYSMLQSKITMPEKPRIHW